MDEIFKYGTDRLTAPAAMSIASGQVKATLTKDTIQRIESSRRFVEEIVANNKTVYGVNTGFGILSGYWLKTLSAPTDIRRSGAGFHVASKLNSAITPISDL